jgi:integrase
VKHRTDQAEKRKKAEDGWEHGLVFPTLYGRYFDRARLYAIFEKVLENAGLPGMRCHGTRHSAATILLSMGVLAKVVQEIPGHSHIGITLGIYGHVLPGMQQEAVEKWDGWFGNDNDTV